MSRLSPVVVLSLAATLLMIGVGMIVALLPQYVHAITGSLESVGMIASIFALAYLLAQLPVGILSDWLGAKWFLVLGYLLCASSGLVFFMSTTPGGIYLGRAIQGLGEAPIWALGPAVLSLAYPTAKGRAIGIYNAAIHAGLTAGPLLGLFIAPRGEGRWVFLTFSGLCLAAGVTVLAFLRVGSIPLLQARPGVRQFLAIIGRREPAVLLAGILIYGAAYGVFVSVLPISLTRTHGFSSTAVSMLFVVFYAAISSSQILAGALSDRFGRRGFLVWGMVLAAASMGAVPLASGLWSYLPLSLASVGLGIFCVASITALNECVPGELKGAISGSYYFFWGAGYVLGPLGMGALESAAPLAGYPALAAAFALVSVVIHLARG